MYIYCKSTRMSSILVHSACMFRSKQSANIYINTTAFVGLSFPLLKHLFHKDVSVADIAIWKKPLLLCQATTVRETKVSWNQGSPIEVLWKPLEYSHSMVPRGLSWPLNWEAQTFRRTADVIVPRLCWWCERLPCRLYRMWMWVYLLHPSRLSTTTRRTQQSKDASIRAKLRGPLNSPYITATWSSSLRGTLSWASILCRGVSLSHHYNEICIIVL